MTAQTEDLHAGAFIVSTANGKRSFESGTVAIGQNLVAGTVLMASGSEVAEWTDGDAIGVLYEAVDASTARKPCTYVARDAEVRLDDLTFPSGTATEDDMVAALLAINIITR